MSAFQSRGFVVALSLMAGFALLGAGGIFIVESSLSPHVLQPTEADAQQSPAPRPSRENLPSISHRTAAGTKAAEPDGGLPASGSSPPHPAAAPLNRGAATPPAALQTGKSKALESRGANAAPEVDAIVASTHQRDLGLEIRPLGDRQKQWLADQGLKGVGVGAWVSNARAGRNNDFEKDDIVLGPCGGSGVVAHSVIVAALRNTRTTPHWCFRVLRGVALTDVVDRS